MSIKNLNPYLMFNGTAGRAIKLYEGALGAKVEGLMRYGDIPGNTPAPENRELIIHAALRIGPGLVMVSDSTPDRPVPQESNTEVFLDFDDVADMTRVFEALAAGGAVTMPPQDTFWGAKFGTLTDAFGIRWMFNCDLEKA
ncbi:glyoxalase/bleomycin resistance/extradiol dioxygenase family protein [Sorangium sp. So ce291]|uniref:VOC family protein n=1 Tax=Sorangium sp. So ce291 TaxID=3133294 RepID=UPI003F602A8E